MLLEKKTVTFEVGSPCRFAAKAKWLSSVIQASGKHTLSAKVIVRENIKAIAIETELFLIFMVHLTATLPIAVFI